MLAQLVDLFGERGLEALYIGLWACPAIGLCFGVFWDGFRFARRWWPVPLFFYSMLIVPGIAGFGTIFLCGGTLLGPVIGMLLAGNGIRSHQARIPEGILWWRRRHLPPTQCCRKCSYDLTGNMSGTCPECGQRIGYSDEEHKRILVAIQETVAELCRIPARDIDSSVSMLALWRMQLGAGETVLIRKLEQRLGLRIENSWWERQFPETAFNLNFGEFAEQLAAYVEDQANPGSPECRK